ncbi:alkaline phosphatase-like protein [Aspergillus pseudodeflectus]|uniref:Alkaline phosphatase-like protein n=1 Tax=Aspergillus pseudodeflectus TaxID=176178 RepID=A0ABR4JHJ7_9EURO
MRLNLLLALVGAVCARPNIVVLLTDDQDLRLGSPDYQQVLQERLVKKGASFMNHHVTTAVCCPSRASLLKGQLAHNTNITHVRAPGGDYDKWVLAGQDNEYLPQYMKQAGYRTELMSKNGEVPLNYRGFHQTDIIRAKDPWLLFLAPTSPHVGNDNHYCEPLARHSNDFENVNAPRRPDFNPEQEFQEQKGYFLKGLRLMNQTEIDWADMTHRRRLQCLQGVDDIIEDTISYLEAKGQMENTYFIFTSDNGYHLGQWRVTAGKSLPYGTDSNVPLVVRGLGIPEGVESNLPGTHVDLVPTMLEIAGLERRKWPKLLDGRSLLGQWRQPRHPGKGTGSDEEVINIEHWGFKSIEAPVAPKVYPMATYKTIRVVGEHTAWLYVVWCSGESELYNLIDDPYEMHNLIASNDPEIERTVDRLNALMLFMKSCGEDTCRKPWANFNAGRRISSFRQAMKPQFDGYFASFPRFKFGECMDYQYDPNEEPFFPPESVSLGSEYRRPTDNYVTAFPQILLEPNQEPAGGWEQRYATIDEIMAKATPLSKEDIYGQGRFKREEAYEMVIDEDNDFGV